MTAKQETIYLQAHQHSVVHESEVLIEQVTSVECANKELEAAVRTLCLHRFSDKGTKSQLECFSMMRVIERIHEDFPDASVASIGEQNFIVEYLDGKKPAAWLLYAKLALLSVLIFFGSAFTIMAFNNDIALDGVFAHFYRQVMGTDKPKVTELEICYSIGISLGILIFFNHVGKRKFSTDPTPIMVEVDKFRKDMNNTMISLEERKGHEQDAS